MSQPQNYKNHTRFDPPWHFFIAPFLLLNVLFSIALTVHHWPQHWVIMLWWDLLSIVLLMAVGVARGATLRVQDRTIRLEERLRYQSLLSPEDVTRSRYLTLRQIIALRFASDAELPALMHRALDQKLSEKQIKQAIVTWRADTYRV
ncbi:MAG TPA: DUF6526 family protein [Acidobacteriaceae bacterium]